MFLLRILVLLLAVCGLDALKIEKAHVVGYSLGGMVAGKLLAEHPDRVRSAMLGGMGWFREGSAAQRLWERIPLPAKAGDRRPPSFFCRQFFCPSSPLRQQFRVDLRQFLGDNVDGPADLLRRVLGRDEKPHARSFFFHRRVQDRLGIDSPLEQLGR